MNEEKILNSENTGLIETVNDTDFVAGGETGITYEILNESYLIVTGKQRN